MLNNQTALLGDVLAHECSSLLQAFFAERRAQKKSRRTGDANISHETPIPAGEAIELSAEDLGLVAQSEFKNIITGSPLNLDLRNPSPT